MPPASREILREGCSAYQAGDDRAAIERADRFIALHPKAQEAGEAHYIRGLARCRLGDFAAGGDDFRQALQLTRRDGLAGRAYAALGELAERDGDTDDVIEAYRLALDKLPANLPPADEAMYRLGAALQRQGQWPDADKQFDRLAFVFDGGELAERAISRCRATAWTIQAGAFESQANAERLARSLNQAGLTARVQPVRTRRVLRAVQVGRFGTYDEAVEQLDAVRRVRPDAFVITAR